MLLTSVNAQESNAFTIRLFDGNEVSNSTGFIRKITFSDNNLVINKTDGSFTPIPLASISKIFFSVLSNSETITPENLKVYIYPNPASDCIQIKNIKNNETVVYIYKLDGTLAISKIIDSGDSVIDVSQLHSGIYIVRVNSDILKLCKK